MIKNALIVGLLGIVIWFGVTIVRLEKYHYASQLGMCSEYGSDPQGLVTRDKCLDEAETRTSWAWHLYYAMR
jgi:hypothetical protein